MGWEIKMALTNKDIADFVQRLWANDYFRFELMSSMPVVTHFEREGNSLIVDYEFWDDGKSTGSQENFMFDIEIGNEYGWNFPANMQFVQLKDKFTWNTSEECENLSLELSEENHLDTDVTIYEWGDPELEDLVDSYFNPDMIGLESVRDMLIEKYHAKNGLPNYIPERLKGFFTQVINSA
jgi:hypothetical protein